MTREIFVNVFRFLLFLLLQGVVFNFLDLFNGLAYPMPYVFAMLMLPFKTPKWLFMVIGLAYGLLIDMWTDTIGMHASACVFLGFVQPFITRIVPVQETFGVLDSPTISSRGTRWYFFYSLLLVFLHHLWLFGIEWFKISEFLWPLIKILLSTIYTTIILLIIQLIFYSKTKV